MCDAYLSLNRSYSGESFDVVVSNDLLPRAFPVRRAHHRDNKLETATGVLARKRKEFNKLHDL